jgi:ferritin-like metal-binding protein YciE
MKFASLNDLYLQQLKDLHSAESQLLKALPKLAKAASNPDLKQAFLEHLEQTKGHLERLKQVAEKLGKRLAGHPCAAMKGLLEEGSEWLAEEAEAEVRDAGIIAGAQRVEHYEMAGYGTVQTFAKLLGEKEAAELFTLTLNEEKAADKKLTLLAKSINVKAKAEKPLARVKTVVKSPAKLPAKIPPSGGPREVREVGSEVEKEPSQLE